MKHLDIQLKVKFKNSKYFVWEFPNPYQVNVLRMSDIFTAKGNEKQVKSFQLLRTGNQSLKLRTTLLLDTFPC